MVLEVWSFFLQFFRDVDEEMVWVQEKLFLVIVQDYGQSLSVVWYLQEQYQNLESEMNSYEVLIWVVLGIGYKLVQVGYFVVYEVVVWVQQLEKVMVYLWVEVVWRWFLLQQVQEVQQFLIEFLEVGFWLVEWGYVLDSEDMGYSVEVIQVFLWWLEVIKRDLEVFSLCFEWLQQMVVFLESRKNVDSFRVFVQLQVVWEVYVELLWRVEVRGYGLQEQLQLYQLD